MHVFKYDTNVSTNSKLALFYFSSLETHLKFSEKQILHSLLKVISTINFQCILNYLANIEKLN